MIDMDYEQKYKEALERAKAQWGSVNDETRSWLEGTFPELRESEDERIIKTLQEYVKNRNWTLNGPTQDEVLAWLEKQKEQPTNEEMLRTLRAEYEKGVADTIAKYEQNEQKPVEPSGKLSREEYLYQLLIDQLITYSDYEYLTGKKSAEWSEDKDFEDCLTELACELYEQRDESPENTAFRECEVLKKWTPILLKKAQQKEEWSEEERKILDSIIDDYEKASKSFCGYDGKIGLLRAIRDGEYNLPKPAWGEEDEKLFWGFTAWVPNEELERLGVTRDDLLKKLKSLRPQSHKWYIKKGHWYMCIVDKPEYGWTKGKVYQSPNDNRIETDYKGDLSNWPYIEPWFRPATYDEIPDNSSHWKPSEEHEESEYYQHFDPDC